jgi:hypothetical protein
VQRGEQRKDAVGYVLEMKRISSYVELPRSKDLENIIYMKNLVKHE